MLRFEDLNWIKAKQIIIFGNSGSGKSTLAKYIHQTLDYAHLDLDVLAWQKTLPPKRMALETSNKAINQFLGHNQRWVIEGCYSDLIRLINKPDAILVWLDLPVETCIKNANLRPWEPHKYASKSEQDQNLEMLRGWIAEYPHREDECGLAAHKEMFNNYSGQKVRIDVPIKMQLPQAESLVQ